MADFRDDLMPTDEIVEKLNEGARDKNPFNRLKYLEKIIDYKGLGTGIGNDITIKIPGLDQNFEVDQTRIKDDRVSIEEFLNE